MTVNKSAQERSPSPERDTLSDSKRLALIRRRAARGYYNSDRVIEEVADAILEWYGVRRGGKLR